MVIDFEHREDKDGDDDDEGDDGDSRTWPSISSTEKTTTMTMKATMVNRQNSREEGKQEADESGPD